jgi:hypothetical protein
MMLAANEPYLTVDGILKPCEYQKSPFKENLDKITLKGVAGCSEPCTIGSEFPLCPLTAHP